MSSKLFDVTGNTTAYYNLEPHQIKDIFVSLSPAARLRKRLLELRRRKPIKVQDASEQKTQKAGLDAFMVAPEYRRKHEPRGKVISDVKTWADIQNSASEQRNGIRVIQYSQLGWPNSAALSQGTWQPLSLTAAGDAIQNYVQRIKLATKEAAEAVGDFIGGKLRPFGMPRTSVHYSLEEGAQTGLLYRLRNTAKIAAPALVILLVLALPAYDWTSNGQQGTDETPGTSQADTDQGEQPPFSGAGPTGGTPTSETGTGSSASQTSAVNRSGSSADSNTSSRSATTSSSPTGSEQRSGSASQPIGEGGFGGGSEGSEQPQPPSDNPDPAQPLTQPAETLVESVKSTVTDTTDQLPQTLH